MATVSDFFPSVFFHDEEATDRSVLCLSSFQDLAFYGPLLGSHILAEALISLFEVILAPSSKFFDIFLWFYPLAAIIC